MAHQCTDCGRAFDDGSKEMLSGCPNCGGNTFQFRPDADPDDLEAAAADSPEEGPPDPPDPPDPAVDSSVARTMGKAATTVRAFIVAEEDTSAGAPSPPEDDGAATTADAATAHTATTADTATSPTTDDGSDDGTEDAAQASARSDVVTADDVRVPTSSTEATREPASVRPPSGDGDRPELSQLRAELNEQFESIKVLEPGQYELNLMELYDREEYIIALQEDGKYTIQVPEGFGDE